MNISLWPAMASETIAALFSYAGTVIAYTPLPELPAHRAHGVSVRYDSFLLGTMNPTSLQRLALAICVACLLACSPSAHASNLSGSGLRWHSAPVGQAGCGSAPSLRVCNLMCPGIFGSSQDSVPGSSGDVEFIDFGVAESAAARSSESEHDSFVETRDGLPQGLKFDFRDPARPLESCQTSGACSTSGSTQTGPSGHAAILSDWAAVLHGTLGQALLDTSCAETIDYASALFRPPRTALLMSVWSIV
jgi:hypothetical protein